MRLKARILNDPELNVAIIHQDRPKSVYLYSFHDTQDHGFDNWYEYVEDAISEGERIYGIEPSEWQRIPDVLPGCLPTFEEPTVGVRGEDGKLTLISYEEAVKLNLVPPQPEQVNITASVEVVDQIRALLSAQKSLEAMKLYMEQTGSSLLEAKQAIEHLANDPNVNGQN